MKFKPKRYLYKVDLRPKYNLKFKSHKQNTPTHIQWPELRTKLREDNPNPRDPRVEKPPQPKAVSSKSKKDVLDQVLVL